MCKYLNSKSWDTRVAAAQTVEAIVKHVKKWDPAFQAKSPVQNGTEDCVPGNESVESLQDLLSFETFDIIQVLYIGTVHARHTLYSNTYL